MGCGWEGKGRDEDGIGRGEKRREEKRREQDVAMGCPSG